MANHWAQMLGSLVGAPIPSPRRPKRADGISEITDILTVMAPWG